MKISMEFPQKLKTRTTTPGSIPKRVKVAISKNTCTPIFIEALSKIAKLWNQTGFYFT
jgi:hypothetical protein